MWTLGHGREEVDGSMPFLVSFWLDPSYLKVKVDLERDRHMSMIAEPDPRTEWKDLYDSFAYCFIMRTLLPLAMAAVVLTAVRITPRLTPSTDAAVGGSFSHPLMPLRYAKGNDDDGDAAVERNGPPRR